MKIPEIIEQAHRYFGKNRRALRHLLATYRFDGQRSRDWKRLIKEFTDRPFDLTYGIFEDVAEHLTNENYNEIDWHWLGDLSWKLRFVLNDNVFRVYDFDKRLTKACNGTARIAEVHFSEIVPSFVIDTYYMSYSKAENYYEFGPLVISPDEALFIDGLKAFFRKRNFAFINLGTALKRFPNLFSDCQRDGHARLFDALFCDTHSYQLETKRFNDRPVKDRLGRSLGWEEIYDSSASLVSRKETTHYPSGNAITVISDRSGQVTHVSVRRSIGRLTNAEFNLDILAEYKAKIRSKGSE